MANRKIRKECDCQRKGFWIEYDAKGNPVYCHTAKHDGEEHIIRQPLSELVEILKPQAV